MPTTKYMINVSELAKTQLLAGEDDALIEWIIEHCAISSIKKGDILLKKGELNSHLYILIEGLLRVELGVDEMPALDFIHPLDCVGEISVLEGSKTSASIVADQDCLLLGIAEFDMWSLINRSHVVARNLLMTLCSRVRNEHNVITEHFQLQRTFERQSKLDSLTGLYNRRWLDDALQRWTSRDQALCILLMDIDYFKKYNDSQGHLAGDSALHTVAYTIVNSLRPSDLAARYGGEEFVAILPEATLDEAVAVANRVCQAIRSKSIIMNEEYHLPSVTISIGVTALQPGQDKNSLLAAADKALYQAKNSGRDRVAY